MRAVVTVDIALTVSVDAEVVLSVVPATGWATEERLDLAVDGHHIVPVERVDAHGTRLHRAVLPAGAASLVYRAEVSPPAAPAASDDLDPVRYLRPSRYVPSDLLGDEASAFVGLPPREIVALVPREVAARLAYAPGSSGPTDSALDTLRAGAGVCRDFAHVTIALLRASGVPARLVSAFAPGLDPMDFHAVVEAFVEGRWEVVDATGLAPRAHLVRIATGRDAADTAFLTTISGAVALDSVEVTAVVRGDLQVDDPDSAVLLR